MNNLNGHSKGISARFKTIVAVFLLSSAYLVYGFMKDPLPNSFRIYVNEQGEVLLETNEGYVPKDLPVHNLSMDTPGCYLSCHSTNPDKGLYKSSDSIYVIGLIRVEGQYDGPFCRPSHYEKVNIKDEGVFKELCSKAYQCVGNSCWAGPTTGDLFGLK